MRATLPLSLVALLFVCFSLVVPASAGEPVEEPIEVNGQVYDSWSEYFRSDQFRTLGGRCGTPTAVQADKTFTDPSDCTLNLTNPLPIYDPGADYPIQVVVHVIMNSSGSQGAISDAMVQSQIDILNEDFQALAGTPGSRGYDSALLFALATVDPGGNATTGITRSNNNTWFNDGGAYYNYLAWDPTRYTNVYTNNAGGYLGYVPFLPQQGGVGGNSDRVVVHWQSFGRNSAGYPYHQGRTLTHELGHYFGLHHTFAYGCGNSTPPACYSSGDRICDTNSESTAHWGCSNSSTCGSSDPIRNYMNYTDDLCMQQFTQEQSRRIRCTLENYREGLIDISLSLVESTPVARGSILRQNRPNPFNPVTELGFQLPTAGSVRLEVLDVTGRLVRTLVNGPMTEGAHTAMWDGTNETGESVASGIYLYHLKGNEWNETKRMVLIR